ncbi:MAG: transporter ATP-binding protein [Herbinix sp.]|jgi:ABC-2 type transport system ATP-binding protein|nr:transporter ATP-binding protein [Herbinix sp.]
MLIHVNGVSKAFKKQKVLNNIDLQVKENEIFGLIGPSGAGKTTLIRLIIGAIGADSGEIKIMDYTIPNLKALNIIGYMPQNDALYSDLSGFDNLMFFGGMYQMSRGEMEKRAHEVLRLVELEADAKKKVVNYSGGMRKRLSLAVSLLHNPKVLILDEPTVGIDPILRKKIWNEFYELKKQGITIIVTTHVMDEAIKCDRLGLIYNGDIIACDTVSNLLAQTEHQTIEELFLRRGEIKG